ncbi:MAG: hypothetical protein JWR22_4284 [Herminiimonas sp.]|nr:hypothetical protein [Herminiimonas sp.]
MDPFAENSGSFVVEVFEKTFGIATILLLVVVLRKRTLLPGAATVFAAGAFVVLTLCYALYVAYYLGVTSLPILLGMAAFPPVCFLLIALHQGNYAALVASVIFGAVHVGLTYTNFAPP